MRLVRALLLAVVVAVCATTLVLAARSTVVAGRPVAVEIPEPAQLSFDIVAKVPRCKDYLGTGPMPREGHAALFVQLDTTTMYYVTDLLFDDAGWTAEDVTLGEPQDNTHFTLYIYAITAEADDTLKALPAHTPVDIMPTRLLDVLVVSRDNSPDTC